LLATRLVSGLVLIMPWRSILILGVSGSPSTAESRRLADTAWCEATAYDGPASACTTASREAEKSKDSNDDHTSFRKVNQFSMLFDKDWDKPTTAPMIRAVVLWCTLLLLVLVNAYTGDIATDKVKIVMSVKNDMRGEGKEQAKHAECYAP
jgi:hypothetical protein